MVLKYTQHQHRLKERFAILKDYAHMIFLTEIGLRDCINDGIYSSSIIECIQCNKKKECQSLSKSSPTNMMEDNLSVVIEHMEIAENYVKNNTVYNAHKDEGCDCDSCTWLSEFERTLSEALELERYKTEELAS